MSSGTSEIGFRTGKRMMERSTPYSGDRCILTLLLPAIIRWAVEKRQRRRENRKDKVYVKEGGSGERGMLVLPAIKL